VGLGGFGESLVRVWVGLGIKFLKSLGLGRGWGKIVWVWVGLGINR